MGKRTVAFILALSIGLFGIATIRIIGVNRTNTDKIGTVVKQTINNPIPNPMKSPSGHNEDDDFNEVEDD